MEDIIKKAKEIWGLKVGPKSNQSEQEVVLIEILMQVMKDDRIKTKEALEGTFSGCHCGFHGYKVLPDCDQEKHDGCARCVIEKIK